MRNRQCTFYYVRTLEACIAGGGKVLSCGMQSQHAKPVWVERTIIVDFENVERAEAAYETAAYRKAVAAMVDGVERDFRIREEMRCRQLTASQTATGMDFSTFRWIRWTKELAKVNKLRLDDTW
jgi:uncharacterized protein (DUF1330 family)